MATYRRCQIGLDSSHFYVASLRFFHLSFYISPIEHFKLMSIVDAILMNGDRSLDKAHYTSLQVLLTLKGFVQTALQDF